jgi:hypothetical protein
MQFTVFYSWQSDLPSEANLRAIRNALRSASSALEAKHADKNLKIDVDEATRDQPGSPNIPATILAKIRTADVVVCDISTINSLEEPKTRRTPNPNVVFELGYAVAELGWERVVLVFNAAVGIFPDDLPFDFDRHRVSKYSLRTGTKDKKADRDLAELLETALEAILTKEPKRPRELAKDPAQTRRARDLKNIQALLSSVHLPTFERFFEEFPQLFHGRVLHFWFGYHGTITSPSFHLYDGRLMELAERLHKAWDLCTSRGAYYRDRPGSDVHVFGMGRGLGQDEDEQKVWEELVKGRDEMDGALSALLKYVREEYLEIDVDELSQLAQKEYLDFQKRMNELLKPKDR